MELKRNSNREINIKIPSIKQKSSILCRQTTSLSHIIFDQNVNSEYYVHMLLSFF